MNANDDWIESLRRTFYPKLHPYLQKFGGYGIGHVSESQYVATLDESEDAIEDSLANLGFQRNPIAAYKTLYDGRKSEGSWALRNPEAPQTVEPGMQLHLTLFQRGDGKEGREIYAHYEDDWRAAPLAHLREDGFSPERGVEAATEYLDENSYMILK